MKVLITGATGLIGFNLASALEGIGWEVCWTGEDTGVRPCGERLPDHIGDVDLRPYAAVFHLAAITDTTVKDRSTMFHVNADLAGQLFRRAGRAGVPLVIGASSAAVYGALPARQREDVEPAPLNIYAESKVQMEREMISAATRYRSTRFVALRFSNVYGWNEHHKGSAASYVYRLYQQLQRGGKPRLFRGTAFAKRDWVYVKDVVRGIVLAMNTPYSTVFNIGSGVAITFLELVRQWQRLLRLDRPIEWLENPYEFQYQFHTCLDIRRATEVLGYRPAYSLREGLMDYLIDLKVRDKVYKTALS